MMFGDRKGEEMTREEKQKIFEPLSRNFETEVIKDYYMDMVAEIPDYIFTMPSSTSGKYHNATQCQTYGQIYHIYMFDAILNHRLRLKTNKELYSTPEERDCMRCVPTFHDAIKCGWNGSKHTVQDHPLLAAQWVLKTNVNHDIKPEHKQIIADCCEAHSGEWNKSRSGQVIMSEPRNPREFFIHECDILASRVDLDYIIPNELKNLLEGCAKVELPELDTYKLTFGKHNGKTLPEVLACDPSWISWAKDNLEREPVKSLLAQL